MKKFYLLIIVSFFCFLPFNVWASDGETSKLFINYDILSDGSMKVQELAVLEGSYNGRLRTICYQNENASHFTGIQSDFDGSDIYNSSGISDLKIYDIDGGSNLEFNDLLKRNVGSEYTNVAMANNGASGVYIVSSSGSCTDLKIFNPSSSGKAFYMEYTLKDVAVVHNDVAEVAWNIFSTNYEDNINYLEARVNLPQSDPSLRVWLRGPLNGNIKKVDNKYALITYNFLGARNAVSFRLMFDKNLVSGAYKHSGINGKKNILAVEKKAADSANAQRNKIKFQNNLVKGATIIWYLLFVIVIIISYRKKKKAEEVDFNIDYYRDFPGEYGPEVLKYLLDQQIDSKAMSASLLNIIDKKAIKVEQIGNDKKDYQFTGVSEALENLTVEENNLYNLLIAEIGQNNQVTLKQIKDYGKSITCAESFMEKYHKWQGMVVERSKQEEFFVQNVPEKFVLLCICLLGCAITVLNAILETGFIIGYVALIFGIIGFIKGLSYRVYTQKGALQYKQWMAFKKFLKDFGTMDEKQLPEIILWEKYLVYAMVLGCAKELEKDMKVRLADMDMSDPRYHDFYTYGYYDRMFVFSSITSSLNSSVATAVASSRSSIAASQASSSGGFGGGASSGGGSFGGGGGGGHF